MNYAKYGYIVLALVVAFVAAYYLTPKKVVIATAPLVSNNTPAPAPTVAQSQS